MEGKTRIPQIIHFIWIDFNNEVSSHPQIPLKYLENIDLCRRLHPDFEIKIWDGKMCLDLLINKYSWFVDRYINFSKPIMRCDAIRFFILHAEGGVYADVDVKFRKNIRPVLNKADCILRKGIAYIVGNDLMIAQKGSDFIYQCCTNIKEDKFRTPSNYHILNTAGPAYLEKQYRKYEGIEKLLIDESLLPPDVFLLDEDTTGEFFAFTTQEGLWQNNWERILVKIFRNFLKPLYKIWLKFKNN